MTSQGTGQPQPTRRNARKRPSQIAGKHETANASVSPANRPQDSARTSRQAATPRTTRHASPQRSNAAPASATQRPARQAIARPRRARRWPWVVAIMVVIALWVPIIGWMTGIIPGSGQQAAEPTAESMETVGNAAEGTAAIEGLQEQGDELFSLMEGKNLSWRDEEFAVDPNRETDWNYEPNDRKVVYLTIDDGPSENTQAVLDILDKYHCKATFFVTGICPDYAYQIKEEYRRGHTIGLHTYSHDYAQVYASRDAYFADLDQIGQVVKEQIGYVPCFVRFPGGSSNAISADYTPGIMSALVNDVPAAGYQYYDWNASSGDGSDHTADELYAYACEFDTLDNVILLCHDSSTKQTTVEALPRIIEHYQSLGYTFEAIDRTSMVPHHGVSN